MSKTLLNIRTDAKVKKEAQRKAKALGLPLSTVVNAYLKEFVRDGSVTFSLSEPQLRPAVGKFLKQASRDIKAGKNIVGPFSTGEEMDAYLDA